jgi:hypothetical protein
MRTKDATVFVCSTIAPPIAQVCRGGTATGACPLARPGATVACAGLRLLIDRPGCPPIVLDVEPDATSCPLRALS